MKTPALPGSLDGKAKEDHVASSTRRAFIETSRAIRGNLGYGDGSDTDNIAGKWVAIPDTGAANTEFDVTHDMTVIPVGFHVMVPPKSGYVYNGATAWSTSKIYLKCSAANQEIRLFLLGPSALTR